MYKFIDIRTRNEDGRLIRRSYTNGMTERAGAIGSVSNLLSNMARAVPDISNGPHRAHRMFSESLPCRSSNQQRTNNRAG